MVDITTRRGKGSILSHDEVDNNFDSLAGFANTKGQPFGLAELDGSGSLAQKMKLSYNQPGAVIRDFSGDEKGKSSFMVAGAMYDNAGPLQLRTGIWSSEQAYTIRLTGMVDSPTMHGPIDITIWKEITTTGTSVGYVNNGGSVLKIDYGWFADGYHGFNFYTKSGGGLARCQLMVAEVTLIGEDLDDEQLSGWSISDVLEDLSDPFPIGRNANVEAEAIISNATQTALDKKANLNSPKFTGTVQGITAAMVGLTDVNNTSDLDKPISNQTQAVLNTKMNVIGGTFTGNVTVQGTASTQGIGYFGSEGLRLASASSFSYLRQAGNAFSVVNSANNSYNLTLDDNGTLSLPRARPNWAGLTPYDTGNFNPANKINIVGGVDRAGWDNGNLNTPCFAGGSSVSYLVRNMGSVYSLNRQSGYIECATEIGPVGCNYFTSDIRKKEKITPATRNATDVLKRFEFIAYNYKKDVGQDPTIRQHVGFSAQNAQEIDPAFATKMDDGMLMPNLLPLVSHLMKAIVEQDERIKKLEAALWKA